MKSAYSYLDKENRRKLRAMPSMTPGTFNKHFTNFHDKIELSLSNEEEADNLRVRFADHFAQSIMMMRLERVKPEPGWFRFSKEYSSEWKKGDVPYYPVNNEKNNALYEKYKAIPNKKVIWCGRCGLFLYMDMDDCIEEAFKIIESL